MKIVTVIFNSGRKTELEIKNVITVAKEDNFLRVWCANEEEVGINLNFITYYSIENQTRI